METPGKTIPAKVQTEVLIKFTAAETVKVAVAVEADVDAFEALVTDAPVVPVEPFCGVAHRQPRRAGRPGPGLAPMIASR